MRHAVSNPEQKLPTPVIFWTAALSVILFVTIMPHVRAQTGLIGHWTFDEIATGTFADSTGMIVGTPFEVGNGPLDVVIPPGASRLQLGINDDAFNDNAGSFVVSVEGSAVPIPGAVWLLGSGLAILVSGRVRKEECGK